MFKLDLEKAEEPEIKLPISIVSSKNQENSRKNIYFCFIDYAKASDCHNKLWNILKEMGIPDHLTCPSWEICMQVKKQQLERAMEQRLVPNRERSISRLYIVPIIKEKKKKTTVKNTNKWRLNRMLLNNQWIIEELKQEIIKCLETYDNEKKMI